MALLHTSASELDNCEHFGYRAIFRRFAVSGPQESFNLTPVKFWFSDYLNSKVCTTSSTDASELKDDIKGDIMQYIKLYADKLKACNVSKNFFPYPLLHCQ